MTTPKRITGGKQCGQTVACFHEVIGLACERGYISRATAERVLREFRERLGMPPAKEDDDGQA